MDPKPKVKQPILESQNSPLLAPESLADRRIVVTTVIAPSFNPSGSGLVLLTKTRVPVPLEAPMLMQSE